MIEWRDYIDRRDDTAVGKPVLKGTRFAVSILMEHLAGGESFDDFLKRFPHVTREQLVAAHKFAAEVLENITSDEAMPPKAKPKDFWEDWPILHPARDVTGESATTQEPDDQVDPEDEANADEQESQAALAGR